MSNVSGMSF